MTALGCKAAIAAQRLKTVVPAVRGRMAGAMVGQTVRAAMAVLG